jgi:hypothetical protein
MTTFEMAEGAKPHALRILFRKYPEVSGVGLTRVRDGWGLMVHLSQKPKKALPGEVDGVPLVSEVVGEVVAQ